MSKWTWSGILSLFSLLTTTVAKAQITVDETGLYTTVRPVYGAGQENIDLGTYVAQYVIQPLFGLSGVIFLAFILYAGILWMTDQGDADQVAKAKRIMTHSTIGLIIMLTAYAITNLILSLATGTALDEV